MANSLPWSVKGVDPRTREAAKAAARRAGLTLGEWLDSVVRDEDEPRAGPPPTPAPPASATPAPSAPAPDHALDALQARLARFAQDQTETSPPPARPAPELSRDEIEAVLARAAIAERLTRETGSKTAGALDSIARWMEKTETRLASGERTVAERQERATVVIADAIKTMGERLVEIERRAVAGRAPAVLVRAPASHEARSHEARSRPETPPRERLTRDGLAAAVSDIRQRQRLLDGERVPASAARGLSDPTLSALRDDMRALSARLGPVTARDTPRPEAAPLSARTDSARAVIAGADFTRPDLARPDFTRPDITRPDLARQGPAPAPQTHSIERALGELQARIDRIDRPAQLEPLLRPIARIEQDMARLANDRSQAGYGRIESEIAQVAARLDALAPALQSRPIERALGEIKARIEKADSGDRLEPLLLPLARIESEVARLAEDRSGEGYARIEGEIGHLAGRIDALARQSGDRTLLAPILSEIGTLRDMVGSGAGEPRLGDLSRQVATLAGEIGRLRESSGGGRERLEPLLAPLARIESEMARLADDRSGEGYSRIESEIGHLAGRIDALAQQTGDRAILAPVLRDLAELRDLVASGAGEHRFGDISRQIATLSSEIGRLRERPAERGDRFEPLLTPLARIESEVARLAEDRSGEGYSRIESEIGHLAGRIDALAQQNGDRSLLAPILRDIGELREVVATSTGERRLEDLSRQVSALSSEIGRLRETQPDGRDLRSLALAIEEVRSSILNDHDRERPADSGALMALSRQVESLAQRLETLPQLPPAAIDAQSDQILRKLDALAATGRPVSDELSHRIEALVARLDSVAARSPADVEARIEALHDKLEHLAQRGPSAMERQIETLSERIESLTAASSLAGFVRGPQDDGARRLDLGPVEDMLRGLADKIDRAGRPGAGRGDFDALERQIAGLAERLDSASATRDAETGIERTLHELVRHLEGLRADTSAAAERAARAALAGMAEQAGGQPGGRSIGYGDLSELMSGLRDTHISAERQTQDAIGAVHRTLETIMQRLSMIERENAGDRPVQPVVRAPAAPAPQAAADLPRVDAASLNSMLKERFGLGVRATEARAQPRQAPVEAAPPVLSVLDRPLEPGSGRPGTTPAPAPLLIPAPMHEAAAAGDAQAVRQNLIAAARRSARAATESAAATGAAPVAQPGAATSTGGRLKDIMERRKRPLLLGLAAVVLAMGTAHVVTGVMRDSKARADKAEIEKAITPGAASQPAPGPPARDQNSALPPDAPGAAPPPASALAAAAGGLPVAAPETTGSAPPPVQTVALPQAASGPEALQPVTGVNELPSTFGTAGMRRAALAGDARAVYEVAIRAADGQSGLRDPKLALRLFERAGIAGLAPAQFRLGNLFEKGVGTQRDPALARVWYGRAAEHGNAKAMHNLAVLNAEGTGAKPDYALATEWFRRAAEFGVRDSQYNLAILLGRGLGAPVDLGQSYHWFAVAAAQGDEDAARKRDEVAARLPAGELATLKAQAAAWKAKPLDPAANEVAAPAKGWDEAPATSAVRKPAAKSARL